MQIRLLNSGIVIANHARIANTFFLKLLGWIGRTEIQQGEALILTSCSSIHTFGMKVRIDVLFLDQASQVIYLTNRMRPNRISPILRKATKIIELKEGTIECNQINVGDFLLIE